MRKKSRKFRAFKEESTGNHKCTHNVNPASTDQFSATKEQAITKVIPESEVISANNINLEKNTIPKRNIVATAENDCSCNENELNNYYSTSFFDFPTWFNVILRRLSLEFGLMAFE